MDTQKYLNEGKTVETTLPDDYIKRVLDNCPIPESQLEDKTTFRHILISNLVQQNLMLDKMCNLLIIATGMSDHDIPEDTGVSMDTLKGAMGKSVVCPSCSTIVVPDAMGYCPKKNCRADLRNLLIKE